MHKYILIGFALVLTCEVAIAGQLAPLDLISVSEDFRERISSARIHFVIYDL